MKLTKTEPYQDYSNLCMVHRGKLILVPCLTSNEEKDIENSLIHVHIGQGQYHCFNPYIVSETEPLPVNVRCEVWNSFSKAIEGYYSTVAIRPAGIHLVIVMPEQFHNDTILELQHPVAAVFRDNDEVLVETMQTDDEPAYDVIKTVHREPYFNGFVKIFKAPIINKDDFNMLTAFVKELRLASFGKDEAEDALDVSKEDINTFLKNYKK